MTNSVSIFLESLETKDNIIIVRIEANFDRKSKRLKEEISEVNTEEKYLHSSMVSSSSACNFWSFFVPSGLCRPESMWLIGPEHIAYS